MTLAFAPLMECCQGEKHHRSESNQLVCDETECQALAAKQARPATQKTSVGPKERLLDLCALATAASACIKNNPTIRRISKSDKPRVQILNLCDLATAESRQLPGNLTIRRISQSKMRGKLCGHRRSATTYIIENTHTDTDGKTPIIHARLVAKKKQPRKTCKTNPSVHSAKAPTLAPSPALLPCATVANGPIPPLNPPYCNVAWTFGEEEEPFDLRTLITSPLPTPADRSAETGVVWIEKPSGEQREPLPPAHTLPLFAGPMPDWMGLDLFGDLPPEPSSDLLGLGSDLLS